MHQNDRDESPRRAGRPRVFDTDAALDKAVRLFWQRGYEATSMADLVAETGVAAASLYAAFDNKAGLFAAVIERYAATFSVHLYAPINDPALSYEAVKGLLERAASSFSEPGTPAGCFMYSAAAAVSPASAAIECLLREKRIAAEALLIERLQRGAAQGEIAANTNPAVLGKFINTVMEGMSVQARDGATLNELLSIAEMALDRWPAMIVTWWSSANPLPRLNGRTHLIGRKHMKHVTLPAGSGSFWVKPGRWASVPSADPMRSPRCAPCRTGHDAHRYRRNVRRWCGVGAAEWRRWAAFATSCSSSARHIRRTHRAPALLVRARRA